MIWIVSWNFQFQLFFNSNIIFFKFSFLLISLKMREIHISIFIILSKKNKKKTRFIIKGIIKKYQEWIFKFFNMSWFDTRQSESNNNERVSTFPRAPGLEPHYKMQFSIIYRTPFFGGRGSYPTAGDIQSVCSKLYWQRLPWKVYFTMDIKWLITIRQSTVIFFSIPEKNLPNIFT